MTRSNTPTAALCSILLCVAAACASSPDQSDAPAAVQKTPEAEATPPSAPALPPFAAMAGSSGDDDLVTDVTITYTFSDGRREQQRWGYGGGATVGGITRIAFKPKADVLTPHAGFMLLAPVEQGRAFDIGPADGQAEGSGQVLLDAPTREGFNVGTGTVQFSRVERLAPGALEVDGVMQGECISLTTAGRTLTVEVVFKGMIIGG